MTWAVTCTDLQVGLGSAPILEANFTYDFGRDGPVLPIMGESGTGKSSLLYVLAALAHPHSGNVCWHNSESERVEFAAELDPAAREAAVEFRRLRTGFALQDASLVPHLTIRENLEWILRQRERGALGVSGGARRYSERIETVVGQFLSSADRRGKIGSILGAFPSKLSGGERLRMALASAMIHDPPILFADEPTGSLDQRSRNRILETLRSWVYEEREQRALLLITHHENEAVILRARFCLRVRHQPGGEGATVAIEPIEPVGSDVASR